MEKDESRRSGGRGKNKLYPNLFLKKFLKDWYIYQNLLCGYVCGTGLNPVFVYNIRIIRWVDYDNIEIKFGFNMKEQSRIVHKTNTTIAKFGKPDSYPSLKSRSTEWREKTFYNQ